MRTRNLNLAKRVAALEASRTSGGIHVPETIDLPDAARQIVNQAVQLGFVITSQEQADSLHAAIDALPPSDRHRISQLMEGSTLVVITGSDANL